MCYFLTSFASVRVTTMFVRVYELPSPFIRTSIQRSCRLGNGFLTIVDDNVRGLIVTFPKT